MRKSTFDEVRRDVGELKNLDTYATIIAAGVCTVLSVLGVLDSSRAVLTAVLAVLALIAWNILMVRHDLEKGQDGLIAAQSDFAPGLIAARGKSMNTYLIGVSLSRTIESSYLDFVDVLRAGGVLRILLVDPEASMAALDARGQASRPTAKALAADIHHSILTLSTLARETAETTGRLSVKLTQSALPFGMNHIDIGGKEEAAHVQVYGYRVSGENRPIFVFSKRDEPWFTEFVGQGERLWADARDCPLDGD